MARQRKKQKSLIKDLAAQRIERLFELAHDEFGQNPKRSDRYVLLARRIGMRYRIRFPTNLKRRMCKHCRSYLVPGSSSRVRLRGRYITVTCLRCNKQMRYPYKSSKNKVEANNPAQWQFQLFENSSQYFHDQEWWNDHHNSSEYKDKYVPVNNIFLRSGFDPKSSGTTCWTTCAASGAAIWIILRSVI